jgi:hypothetical protein
MDLGESLFVGHRSRSGLHMSNQLRRILITGLGKVNFEADPHGGPFLAVASVQIIGGVDKLSGWKSRFRSPLPSLLERLELLLEDSCAASSLPAGF